MRLARHQQRHSAQTERRAIFSAQAAAYNQKPDLEKLTRTARALVAMKMVAITEAGFTVQMASFQGRAMSYDVIVADGGKLKCECFNFETGGVCAHTIAAEVFTEENVERAAAESNEPVFVEVTKEAVVSAIERANRQSFTAFITSANNDRTKFEVFSAASGKTYNVELRETTDGRVLGKCDCADFVNRNRVCKHLSVTYSSRKSIAFGLAA